MQLSRLSLTTQSSCLTCRPQHLPFVSRPVRNQQANLVQSWCCDAILGQKRRPVSCHASKLDEIDPVTGDVIEATASATVPSESISVDGLRLTYRTAVPSTPADPPQQLLLLHGLGSNSYAYRGNLQLLADSGYQGFAVDWVGHGFSDKPSPTSFDYSEGAYKRLLSAIVDALPLVKPFTLLVHGFVLSQYAMLWALENEDLVDKLIIVNSPVSAKSQLRPELAAYKNPIAFLRPKPDKPFDGMTFNAAGSPYAMAYKDAQVYAAAYEDGSAANVALATTLDKCDWPALCKRVDEGFRPWKKPSLLVWGNKDPFLDTKVAFDFLESKRTTMRMAQFTAKLGHCPMEDYPQAIHDPIVAFLQGKEEEVAASKRR